SSGRRLHGDDLRPHQSGRRRYLRVLGSTDPVPVMSGDAMMPRASLGSPGVPVRRWTATPRGRRLLRMGVLLIAVVIAGFGAPFLVPYDHDGDRKSTTSELQSRENLVCRLLLEKKKKKQKKAATQNTIRRHNL